MEAYDFGGPAKNLAYIQSHLEAEFEVKVFTFLRGDMADSDFIRGLKKAGIEVEVIREKKAFDFKAQRALIKRLNLWQPDLLQIHNTKSRLYTFKNPSLKKIPNIYFYHGETWTSKKQKFYNRLDRRLFKQAKHIIVVSPHQIGLLEKQGVASEKIFQVYNAIPYCEDLVLKPEPSPFNLISVGRFSNEKGQLILLEAVKLLKNSSEVPFLLTLLGDGPDRPLLEQFVSHNGLEEVVRLEGHKKNIHPYYQVAHILILPSLTEGIPNVLIEAAQQKVCLVATNVGGISHMFEDGKEIDLVPANDPDTLAHKLNALLELPEVVSSMGQAASERVNRQFLAEKRAERLMTYYKSLLV